MENDVRDATTSGHGCVSSATRLSKFSFMPSKVHRLRLINSGAENLIQFSIDQHHLTAIANDFTPVIPYQARFVTLGVASDSMSWYVMSSAR